MRLLPLFMFVMMTLVSFAAFADSDGLHLPPEGHTLLNLSASERQTLPQDLLMASLRIEVDSADPVKVQNDINQAMEKALAEAKGVTAVKASTGGYNVYKYNPDQRTSVWRGTQTIELESKDAAALLKLVGEIQKSNFVMNGLNYTLSPEKAESVRDELMTKALQKLQEKAALVAKTLGKSGYELTDVSIDGGGPVMPMYKTMAMRGNMEGAAMDMAAPVAEPGEADVSLSVSARVLLKP